MIVSPRDRLMAMNRLRRAILAFQSAQILVLTHRRQKQALSQVDLDAVQHSAVEAAAALLAYSATGLVVGADDQRILAQARKSLADGAA